MSLFVLVIAQSAAARLDLDRERRMAAQIVDAILDGEPISLQAAGHEFFGIHTESMTDSNKGAVLILHGRGFHPDWVDLIQPLRIGLTEHGWSTLSIQMPVLENPARYNDYFRIFPDAAPRIDAGIDFLEARGHRKIILLAHSCGSHMAQHWIHHRGMAALNRIDAYVGVGMGASDFGQPLREPYALAKMPQPVLDLFGEDDYPAVQRMAEERRRLMKIAGHPKSAQVTVPGADHYFKGKGDQAVSVIADWLDTLSNGGAGTR